MTARTRLLSLALFAGALSSAAFAAGASLVARDVDARDSLVAQDGKEVLRTQFVELNLAALPAAQADGPLNAVELSLHALGADLPIVLDRVEVGYAGGVTYIGHLADRPNASVILSRFEEAVYADIRELGAAMWQIRYAGEGVHAINLADESQLADCGSTEREFLPELGALVVPDASATTDGPVVIDVLTLYTPLARNQAGGTNGMIATMNGFISTTNNAYINSQINQRVRLVHLAETNYVEATGAGTPMGTDLDRLRANGDGFMDEVHSLRNTYGADLCHLVSGVPNGACGIAYLGLSASLGFGVTARSCGSFTYAHELGHNMGCAHDHNNAGSSTFCYSYGWRSTNNQWRTIMSYDPGNRIAWFSNPNITLQLGNPPLNYVIGISEADGCGNNTAADNSRTMNQTQFTIASYRATQVGNPPPDSFNLLTPANNAVGVSTGPTFNWQTAPLATDYSITVSPNPDLADPVFQDNVNTPGIGLPAGLLTYATRYYWSVTASNLGGQTPSASGIFTFKVRVYGDISGNGVVDFADLNIVLGQFGQTGPGLPGDVNGDLIVNFADLNIVLSNFGQS